MHVPGVGPTFNYASQFLKGIFWGNSRESSGRHGFCKEDFANWLRFGGRRKWASGSQKNLL
jgi:hypothetical protein